MARTKQHRMHCVALGIFAVCVGVNGPALSGEQANHVIRVAVYADEGATKPVLKNLRNALPEKSGFNLSAIMAKEIQSGALDKFDVLIQPGGSGSTQGKTLCDEGRKRIQQFVADGGGFIGICAGAYLASAQYPWSLALLNARVIDGAHWARGQGNVQLRLSSVGEAALSCDEPTCTIHYENGPLLGPGEKKDVTKYELLATFDSELRENGAPRGIMKGTAAIARGKYGKGRVVCFSPHPEKTPGRETFLQSTVRWAAGDRAISRTSQPQSGERQ
jgi:glutamine amidotransferase-like uncharacterized protein